MSYEAIVTRIHTRPHPKADRLQLGTAAGHQVVTGPDTESGQLGIFFPCDGALSHEFCYENNEYRSNKGENKDKDKSGYFDSNRRVKTINLRGEKSEGYWVPLDTVKWTGVDIDSLEEGFTFTALNGKEVCHKYFSPATTRAMRQGAKSKAKKDIPMFKQHFDTKKLRYTINDIPQGARLHFTEKLHGTSGRTGHVLVPNDLTWFEENWNKYMSWTGLSYPTESWKHVTGTRRVTLDPDTAKDNGYYSGTNFRADIHNSLSLKKGETLYYEIVGYEGWMTPEDGPAFTRPIMGRHCVSGDSKDVVRKNLAKQYGDEMIYSYGTSEGEFKIFIYRITQTNVDGDVVELGWEQVKTRCRELGLSTVPELRGPIYLDAGSDKNSEGWVRFVTNREGLLQICETYSQGGSTLDPKHIKEGLCIRYESGEGMNVYKYKSFSFCHLEGIAKNSDDYVDLEEIS